MTAYTDAYNAIIVPNGLEQLGATDQRNAGALIETTQLNMDLLLRQVPVVTTGTGTATANKYHTLGGTSYTFNLPAAGNAGDVIMLQALSGLTGIVTIDPNAFETIGGGLTYGMAAGDVLFIRDNGTNWDILWRDGLVVVEASSTSGQVVTAGTEPLDYATEAFDTHQAWDGSSFIAPRDGIFPVTANTDASTASSLVMQLAIGGTVVFNGQHRNATANEIASITARPKLLAGQVLTIVVNIGITRLTAAASNKIYIGEEA